MSGAGTGFRSYYGRPVLKQPVWRSPDIPGYLFCGGLAGAGSLLAAGAHLSGRPALARRTKVGSVAALALGAAGLVHDLGRPSRAANMLRVVKPTSPMSIGSWLLTAYGPLAAAAAFSDVTGVLPWAGTATTLGAAVVGSGVASYTGALLADTAVPAWHDGYRELPYVFAASGATAAAGLGLLAAPVGENLPARRLAVAGAATEAVAAKLLTHRLGMVAEPYQQGRPGAFLRAGEVLALAGATGAVLGGGRSRPVAMAAGAALMVASACTRWGIFHAGLQSAKDPKYTIVPQRQRLEDGRPG